MSGNGLLAGLVAITAPSGFVNPVASVIIGVVAGVLVCLSVEFFDRVARVDDPVGAISVHGANGLWGVISVGLFADGRSNYGGAWNGVPGSVTGLFYGDAGQLVAQLIGVATLIGFVFSFSFIMNILIDWFVGQRVSARAELEGSIFRKWARSATRVRHPRRSGQHRVGHGERTGRHVDAASAEGADPPAGSLARSADGLAGGAGRTHRAPRAGLLANPESADLRTCLGMAYAVNYEVYKSMDALEAATSIDPTHFWGQLKLGELNYRLRALTRAEQETLKAVDLAQNGWQLSLARKQLQQIREMSRRAFAT
jgi:hypothetical protein